MSGHTAAVPAAVMQDRRAGRGRPSIGGAARRPPLPPLPRSWVVAAAASGMSRHPAAAISAAVDGAGVAGRHRRRRLRRHEW